jgi:hypothetical protein
VIEDARTLPIAIPLNHQNHGVVAAETFGIARNNPHRRVEYRH